MQHSLEQLGAAFGAFVMLCGTLATILPQQWGLTKLLTKIGAMTFRAATVHTTEEAK